MPSRRKVAAAEVAVGQHIEELARDSGLVYQLTAAKSRVAVTVEVALRAVPDLDAAWIHVDLVADPRRCELGFLVLRRRRGSERANECQTHS
jgi:hypothetical protein